MAKQKTKKAHPKTAEQFLATASGSTTIKLVLAGSTVMAKLCRYGDDATAIGYGKSVAEAVARALAANAQLPMGDDDCECEF